MARTTLNAKLKKRSDYEKVVEEIKLAGDPLKFIVFTYGVSKAIANKLIKELDVKKKVSKYDEAVKILDRFNNELTKDDVGVRILTKLKEKLEESSIELSRELFSILLGVESKAEKEFLIKAVIYTLQVRNYVVLFKNAMPVVIQTRCDEAIKDCQ